MAERFILSDGVLITAAGGRIELTPNEAVLLGRLTKRAPDESAHYVSLQRIARAIWGPGDSWPDSWANEIRVIVNHIRNKLAAGRSALTIESKIGFGYRLIGDLAIEEGAFA